MLNFFNQNILPLSDELAELLDDKMRAEGQIVEDEARIAREEANECAA